MGRELRMVPVGWEHPREYSLYIPLMDGYEDDVAGGYEPDYEDYMHPVGERTHYMMYETISEGTPISPSFSTPEELASWLVENNAALFAKHTASYDEWISIIKNERYSPVLVGVICD